MMTIPSDQQCLGRRRRDDGDTGTRKQAREHDQMDPWAKRMQLARRSGLIGGVALVYGHRAHGQGSASYLYEDHAITNRIRCIESGAG